MFATPITSDGKNVYAISRVWQNDEDKRTKSLIVEVFSLKGLELSKIREFVLKKKQNEHYIGKKTAYSNDGGFLNHFQIACNGQAFVLNTPRRMHIFDAKTGLRIFRGDKRSFDNQC